MTATASNALSGANNAPPNGGWVSSDQYMTVINENNSLRSTYQVLVDKYQQLESDHQELEREYKDLEARAVALRKQHREDKKLMRDWKAYIDKYYETGQLQLRGSSASAEAPLATPRTLNRESSDAHVKPSTAGLPTTLMEPPLSRPAIEAAGLVSRSTSHSNSAVNRITSSQTTQGDLLSSEPHICEDDEDLPVVVSTRTLKRKRISPGEGRNPDEGTPLRPLAIKEESRSSPELLSRTHLLRTETSDLDALQGDDIVPKQKSRKLSDGKLQRYQQTGRWTRSESRERPDADTMEISNENDEPEDEHQQEEEVASVLTPQQQPQSRGARVDDSPNIKAEPGIQDLDRTPRAQPKFNPSRTSQRQSSGPLQPLSTNTSTLPRTSPHDSKLSKSKGRDRGAAAVHLLTEDGESIVRTAKKIKPTSFESKRKPSITHRLSDLLEHGSPPGPRSELTPRSATAVRRRAESRATPSIEQPTTGRSRRSIRASRSPRKQTAPDDDPGPVLPEDEPMRIRALQRLSLDDFKINPDFNDYRGYAYSESVRKKAERQCLPGCTRECCADIRRFAEAGLLPKVPRKQGLFDSSQDDLDDDTLTLQGYLGAGYTRTIKNATAEEKKRMLVDARAKAFADQHGKHRQVYERRNTPPGFWRTDMPTTQEAEEDKIAALKLERQKVEERWRDAMRGGGRYVFKDE